MRLPNRYRVALATWGLLAALLVQGCGGGSDAGGGNPPPSGGGLPAADTTAPTVPQNLMATAISTTQVNLTWVASTDSGGAGLAGYRVLRGGVEIATTTQTNFSNTGLTPNTAYSYAVRAYDNATPANISANSLLANVTTLALDTTAPTVPQSLVANAVSSTQVNLTWLPSTDSGGSGLAGYRVFRGGVQIATTAATSYSNTGLMPNTAYTYTVRAYDNATPGNVSADSSPPANVTTLAAPDTTAPTVPQNVLATAISSSQVNLTWTASTDSGGSGLAGYRVFRDSAQIATTAATNYSNTGLAASTTYIYTVRAYDNATPANVSADSAAANVTTPAGVVGGLDARPVNTTCLAGARPTGSDTASVQRVFSALSFSSPILALQAPGDSTRWFVVEQAGQVRVFNNNPAVTSATLFVDIDGMNRVTSGGETGLLGMAFHPNFPADRRVFLSYTAGNLISRISSFLTLDNGLTLDPNSERILLTLNQPESNHNGGNIAFGPDGLLYIGFGDGGSGGDPHTQNGPIGNGQSLTTMLGKMLRIDVGAVETATTYTIPSTNPFAANQKCGPLANAQSCPEIYAYGLRNPWRWSFDRQSGDLWLGDVGQGNWEEVDIVVKGGNYGWRCREGRHTFGSQTGCPTSGFIDPVAEYDHGLGVSITGGYVYRGPQTTALRGRYIFGDYGSGNMWTLLPDNAGGYTRTNLVVNSGLNISSFAQANNGELYVVDYNGGLYRLVFQPGTGGGVIPTSLAATGCVDPGNPTQPAPGLIPYSVNAPFWSDGAVKDRWIGLPGGQNITVGAGGDWDFPNGTVLMKNFSLGPTLVETRLFMHHTDGSWAGYSFQWNDAQTDATLIPGGGTKLWGTQSWLYPSEAVCVQCHTAVAGRSLGPETAQMNRNFTYPQTGRTANQITTLNAISTLTPAIAGDPATLPAIPDPASGSGTLAERARSYLHTNCSQCHRTGGPTPVNLDLRYTTALNATNACGVLPQAGDLGLGATARIIAPGSATNSVLVSRMNRRNDSNQMPPIGSNQIDTAGVALLTQWINGLVGCN